MEHLLVCLLVVERNDRDTVVDLVGERIDRIVNDDHVLHASIGNDAQVFHVVALGCLHAMLSVETVLEKFVLWVNVVEDGVGVGLMRGCEHDHLERFVGLLQALHQVGAKVDPCANCLLTWEVNLENDIWILSFDVVDTVDQRLIHVKNEHFLMVSADRLR